MKTEEQAPHEHRLARTIACRNVRQASQLAHNAKKGLHHQAWRLRKRGTTEGMINVNHYQIWYMYQIYRREATIWQMVTCVLKTKQFFLGERCNKALMQGLANEREELYELAIKRMVELKTWVENNPHAAEAVCAPLFAEYEARKARRALEAKS